jgi:hypothetical protein
VESVKSKLTVRESEAGLGLPLVDRLMGYNLWGNYFDQGQKLRALQKVAPQVLRLIRMEV